VTGQYKSLPISSAAEELRRKKITQNTRRALKPRTLIPLGRISRPEEEETKEERG